MMLEETACIDDLIDDFVQCEISRVFGQPIDQLEEAVNGRAGFSPERT